MAYFSHTGRLQPNYYIQTWDTICDFYGDNYSLFEFQGAPKSQNRHWCVMVIQFGFVMEMKLE